MGGKYYKVSRKNNKNSPRSGLIYIWGGGGRHEYHSTTRSPGILRFGEPRVDIWKVNTPKFQKKITRTHQDSSLSIFGWGKEENMSAVQQPEVLDFCDLGILSNIYGR
jgi:hypothetical protein